MTSMPVRWHLKLSSTFKKIMNQNLVFLCFTCRNRSLQFCAFNILPLGVGRFEPIYISINRSHFYWVLWLSLRAAIVTPHCTIMQPKGSMYFYHIFSPQVESWEVALPMVTHKKGRTMPKKYSSNGASLFSYLPCSKLDQISWGLCHFNL